MTSETRDQARQVPPTCPTCAAANAFGARFCNQCGSSLSPPPSLDSVGDAERRQITVVFADLVDSTALARELDAEDFGDVIREFWAICEEVVAELGGRVSQHLGDGVMAYFGHPISHDDDPRRATEASLRILDRTRQLRTRLQVDLPSPPKIRVGVHTGVTVIGQRSLALGETPNLAARLQALATSDSIVVSDATRRLVQGYFHLRSLGHQSLKGFAEPMEVYEVVGSTAAQTRVDAAGRRLTTLVGRDREGSDLTAAWQAAMKGTGPRLVFVSGEPGIGKSRLVHDLKGRLEQDGGCSIWEGYCSPLRQNAVLKPILQALEAASEMGSAPDAPGRIERFENFMRDYAATAETASLLAPLLALPIPEDPTLAGLAPGVRRQRTMRALASLFRSVAARGPLLLVVEDLHWADASTIELLGFLTAADIPEPMMVLSTARPEFVPPWRADSFGTVNLSRLPPELAERIIGEVAGEEALSPAVRSRIVSRAEGVPLFIEEISRATLEAIALRAGQGGARPNADDSDGLIPPSIRDSLAARLDRLGPSKGVAQLAAIVGREASGELLSAVGLMDEAELRAGLRRLTEAGLLVAEERGGQLAYQFKHALIQEASYHSVLKSKRRQYHHRVASVLLDQFPAVAAAEPDTIAQHYARANLPKPAATYFERAGAAAFAAQAYAESTNHLRNALEQIGKLGTGKERDGLELEAQAAIGLPLLMTQGYAAPDVESTYARAMELTAEVDPPLRVLFGIWGAQLVGGHRQNAEQMAARFRLIAEGSRDPGEKLICWAAVGSHAFWRGDFRQAITALKAAVAEFEPEMLMRLPRDYGYDNALWGHLYLAWTQQVLGQFADAKATWDMAWDITEKTRAPYFETAALSFGAAMARDVGDVDRMLEMSRREIALAAENQFAFYLAIGQVHQGSALCQGSKIDEGTALIEQGLQFCRAIGVRTPNAFAYLADAYWRQGATQKGLQAVAESLEIAETYIDRSGLSEALLLKAKLLIQEGAPRGESEAYFVRSLEIARAQGAILMEARSAMDFADALRKRGDVGRAIEILDSVLSRAGQDDLPLLASARRLRSEIAVRPG